MSEEKETYLAKETTISASSELISVKVRRDAWAQTSRARASTVRVMYGSSWDGRRAEDKLQTKYHHVKQ